MRWRIGGNRGRGKEVKREWERVGGEELTRLNLAHSNRCIDQFSQQSTIKEVDGGFRSTINTTYKVSHLTSLLGYL